jgi:TonB family protein
MDTVSCSTHSPAEFSPEPRSVSSQGLPRVVALLPGLLALSVLLMGCGGEGEVEDPTPLYGEVPIEYPLDLWDADVEGQTLLRVRVTETGAVDSVEVLEASGYPAFDSAAVRGALQLRYDPARRKGSRITVWARVPVHFTKGT